MNLPISTKILAALFCITAMVAMVTVSVSAVERMVDGIRTSAIDGRDAHWRAEIEKANTASAERETAQAREALRLETETSARVRAAENELERRKNDSAALANADACGLSRERVRLLPD